VADVVFELNGQEVSVPDGTTLLVALRESCGIRSAKDGCAPQGQCGCCTVWVDGEARVACVTPVSRVRGRSVTTLEGAGSAVADHWSERLCATGGSQCGFCTPGIIMRLAAPRRQGNLTKETVEQALLAHLCRCTGWQTIVEGALDTVDLSANRERAAERAAIEGRTAQAVAPSVAEGNGGFAGDSFPSDALVAVRSAAGTWCVAESLTEARAAAGIVQGRRSTLGLNWPIECDDVSEFVRTLRTTWVEPAYLEPDAVWCEPGGRVVGPLVNGGAFGGKRSTWLADEARRLADDHSRPIRIALTREDVVRLGPKRPPMAAGVRADGSGVVWLRRTEGAAGLIAEHFPNWTLHEVDVAGPPSSLDVRGAVWAELSALMASVASPDERGDHVRSPEGAEAWARVDDDGVRITVRCGDVLDHTVLRSYCIGAAHMALGWVRTEGIAVDETGGIQDLTIRSFGVLRAVDMPPVSVSIVDDDRPPVNGSDAVFAAVAAAAWRRDGYPTRWPASRE
jgi:xanthine dehydrogenase small subunit